MQVMMKFRNPKLVENSQVRLPRRRKKYTPEKTVEELKRQLQPKRTRTHDDDHEILAKVDKWDLSVHHQDTTRVQNRRNVKVESVGNQPKIHTSVDKCGRVLVSRPS
jgi:hypothetical protein